MVDIAALGYSVDTSGLIKGEAALTKFHTANQRVADSAKRAKGATEAFGVQALNSSRAIQLNALQLQNLQFQLNDVALGLSTGQSPFTVLAQQGLQVAQIFQSGTGLKAAIKAIGSGIGTFLLNPINLSVLAVAGLAGGVSFLYSTISESFDVEKALEKQSEIVDELADKYDLVAAALKRLKEESDITFASTVADTDKLSQQLKTTEALYQSTIENIAGEIEDLASYLVRGIPVELLPDDLSKYENDLRVFAAAVREGGLEVDDLRGRLTELAQAAPEDFFASELRKMSDEADNSKEGLRAIVNLLNEIQAALGGIGETAQNLGDVDEKANRIISSTFSIFDEAAATERLTGALKKRQPKKGREPKLNEFQKELQSVQERTRALQIEAQTFGLAAEAAARYQTQQDLINAASEAKIALTPELVSQINEEANAYADATRELEEMEQRQSTIQGLSSVLFGAVSGANSLADAFTRLSSSLIDVVLRAALLGEGPLANLVGTGGLGGNQGGILGTILGGFLAQGGIVQGGQISAFARGGVVNRPTLFPMANGAGLMGEAGPEGVLPLSRMPNGNLGVQAGGIGGGGGTQVNVYNYGKEEVQENRRKDGSGKEIVDVIVGKVRDDMARGGFDQTLSSRFGARPQRKGR